MPKIIHFRSKCIGCYYCVEIAPSRWTINMEDGKALLRGSIEKKGVYQIAISLDEIQTVVDVANVCPVNIIRIEG